MRFLSLLALLTLVPIAASAQSVRGIDASFHADLRDAGVQWRDASGTAQPLPEFARAQGANLVRLRVWNNAANGANSVEETAAEAALWKARGFAVLIDFHYSDTWADPGTQTKPAAWSALTGDALRTAVHDFTRDAVAACAAAGGAPDYVQVGNEITGGMLWSDGRVGGAFDTPQQWAALAGLLRAGIDGVRAGTPEGATPPKIIIHTDRGGDSGGALWFHGNLAKQGLEYDIIGISYYPMFQGSLDALSGTMTAIAEEFPHPIMIMETGYPWTLAWQDDTHNQVGSEDQLHPGFPATPQGQRDLLMALRERVTAQPRCLGFVYWAPDWIVGGPGGSAWENVTLFDAQARAQPAWEAFAPPASAAPNWDQY